MLLDQFVITLCSDGVSQTYFAQGALRLRVNRVDRSWTGGRTSLPDDHNGRRERH